MSFERCSRSVSGATPERHAGRVRSPNKFSRGATTEISPAHCAGLAAGNKIRPEGTVENVMTVSGLPTGRKWFSGMNQTLCVWLISSCPVGTKRACRTQARFGVFRFCGGMSQTIKATSTAGQIEFLTIV